MAINQKISRKKIIIYSLLMILMVIGNMVIYFKNSSSNRSSDALLSEFAAVPEAAKMGAEPSVATKQNQQIKSIVENNLFITLQKIGDWPIQPKNVGKTDPFAPFFKQP